MPVKLGSSSVTLIPATFWQMGYPLPIGQVFIPIMRVGRDRGISIGAIRRQITGPSLHDLITGGGRVAPLFYTFVLGSLYVRVRAGCPPPFIFLWDPVSYKVLLSLAKCIRI